MEVGQLAIPIVVGGLILVVLMMGVAYASFYIKSPPNKATILTGRRGSRIIRGGAALRIPIVERLDIMPLDPFDLGIQLNGAVSSQGVAVNIDATALVRFGSSEDAIRTAAERFLNVDRTTLQRTVQEILTGHMRSIIAKMTVEQLNGNREELVQRVTQEAGTDFARLGMELDVLTIKHMTDEVGYLEALGRTQVAQVLRDAEIGEAEAKRETMVKSAQARQEGETADAAAQAAIAEAQRDRDVRMAQAQAETERERATASQAGPLATATAQKQVVAAEVAVEAQREAASIAVEEQRIERSRKRNEADVIVPAEAERQAAVLRAEGARDAAIATAEGERERLTREGQGEADARTAKAAARKAELQAEAEGVEATLLAEAKGKRELADALNQYQGAAVQLTVAPELVKNLPAVYQAIAGSFGNVEKIVMIDSGSADGQGTIGKFVSQIPAIMAAGGEGLKMLGLDLSAFTGGSLTNGKTGGHENGDRPRVKVGAAVEERDDQPAGDTTLSEDSDVVRDEESQSTAGKRSDY